MSSSSPPSSSPEKAAKRPRLDPVIGLDVAGKLYYCRKSTLCVGASSYFSARFGPDRMLDPEVDRVDANGREIFFIDRDPEMFKYILDYLRMNKLPPRLGSFQQNSDLWRALREEAQFFALDGLSSFLEVTFACSPEEDGGKGILYWLGTNKGKEGYENPYKRQIIHITGWFDSESTPEFIQNEGPVYGTYEAREFFVQYRPIAKEFIEQSLIGSTLPDIFPTLMKCEASDEEMPIVVDFQRTLVSPSHYSLRWGGCYGMSGNWNFEASTDGNDWVVLHAGRGGGDHKLSNARCQKRSQDGEIEWLRRMFEDQDEDEDRQETYCDYMENNYRHIWNVNNSPGHYFRYFRLIGSDKEGETNPGCLHAISLEIYGDVHED